MNTTLLLPPHARETGLAKRKCNDATCTTLAPLRVAGPPPDGRSLELPVLRSIVAGRQTEGSVCHCLDALALALLTRSHSQSLAVTRSFFPSLSLYVTCAWNPSLSFVVGEGRMRMRASVRGSTVISLTKMLFWAPGNYKVGKYLHHLYILS